ncbi:MAG TPA: hypothetical protein VI503_00670 [Gaiellaceae bacterium]|nr:hypothetical protein [Gaiellaceae bacterium]
MTRRAPFRLALAVLAVLVLSVPAAAATGRWAPGTAIELQGTLGDAPYRVKVPGNWNGTLLVFAHGYGRSATQPIPITPNYGSAGQEQFFLDRGYALAASAYSRPGWAVKEGIQETLALANWFKGHVGMPMTTVLWGRSMGSVVAMESLERFPGAYDGVIPMCAVGAGSPRAFDGAMAVAVAYDAAFGWPAAWGPIDDVRDDISFNTDVVPLLVGQLMNPANIGRFEFIRLVSRLPASGFYSPPTALEAPFLFQVMFFATEGRAELERRAGGNPVQNLDHSYTLGAGEQAYLGAFGVDANALLASMNAKRTISAERNARNWLEHYATYTGTFRRPAIALWGIHDGLVPAFHASAYRETVKDPGLYLDGFADSPGHCNYSDVQLLEIVTKMESWITTGVKPAPLSAPGIVPGYVPAPFPVP